MTCLHVAEPTYAGSCPCFLVASDASIAECARSGREPCGVRGEEALRDQFLRSHDAYSMSCLAVDIARDSA